MSEEEIKDMLLKQCLELTTNNDLKPPISAYNGVDIDDVVRACKQLQDKKTYLDLEKENKELKKQLEEFRLDIINGEPYIKLKTVTNQQKEFIEYLENEIKHYKEHFEFVCKNSSLPSDDTRIILEKDDLIIQKLDKILSKYIEIIGGNNGTSV